MLQPVGTLSPVVYWRRRLVVLAPVVLILLTLYVACSGSSEKPAAAPAHAAPGVSSGSARPSGAAGRSGGAAARAGSTNATPVSVPAKANLAPVACAAAALKISAVTGAATYRVNQQPTLLLQVINSGPSPCVKDLSDQQIELLVYNGESRVWGSHDCLIQPGSSPQTLPAATAVRRSIVWTGLSSQPACTGTRQRVGPGSYTLHARLGGVEGATATFTLR